MSTQQELLNSILVLFPDNTTGEITPADLRAFQTDFVNSVAGPWVFTLPAANTAVSVLGSNVSIQVYNTGGLEFGVFGWQNTPNVLTIGTALSGGVARPFQFIYGGTHVVLDYGVTSWTWTIPKGEGLSFGNTVSPPTTDYGVSIGWDGPGQIFIDGAGAVNGGASATELHVSNYQAPQPANNYEYGVFGWKLASNVLSIGTVAVGTGTPRPLQFTYGGTNVLDYGVTTTGAWTIQNSVILGTGALATTATSGFLYLDSCAGAPTGVPAAATGRVPIVIDTSTGTGKLWAYIGSTWRGIALA